MKSLKRLGLATAAAIALIALVGAASAAATTIEINGVTKNQSVEMTISQKVGTSSLIKDEFGTTTDTCTVLDLTIETESPYTTTLLGAKITALGFTNCTHTTTVLSAGTFDIHHITGTTNGLIVWTGGEITVQSTFFGASAVCKGGTGTTLGTLTGVKEGSATVDLNATLNCGILGSSSWTGTWVITSPAGAGIEA